MIEKNKKTDKKSADVENPSQKTKEFVNALLKITEMKETEDSKNSIDFRFILISLGIFVLGISIFLGFTGHPLTHPIYILSSILIIFPFLDLIHNPPKKGITFKSREIISVFIATFSNAMIFILSVIFLT